MGHVCLGPRPVVSNTTPFFPATQLPTVESCSDYSGAEQCAEWKDMGICESLPVDMGRICKKTCGFCGVGKAVISVFH